MYVVVFFLVLMVYNMKNVFNRQLLLKKNALNAIHYFEF